MNSVLFTPNYSVQNVKNSNLNNKPVFKGLPKAPKSVQVKESGILARKLYDYLFVPFGESVTKMTDKNVFTQRKVNKSVLISTKYNKWSRKPVEIVEDNAVSKIRTRKKMHSDGNFDFEIQDLHTPGYKISVGYENIKDAKTHKYSGTLHLNYCDKKVDVSDKERVELLDKMDKIVSDRYDDFTNKFFKRDPSFNALEALDKFYKDPDVIGASILRSPSSLKDRLDTVKGSLPYGIERIIEHLGK